jgi:hypothetical protein
VQGRDLPAPALPIGVTGIMPAYVTRQQLVSLAQPPKRLFLFHEFLILRFKGDFPSFWTTSFFVCCFYAIFADKRRYFLTFPYQTPHKEIKKL